MSQKQAGNICIAFGLLATLVEIAAPVFIGTGGCVGGRYESQILSCCVYVMIALLGIRLRRQ